MEKCKGKFIYTVVIRQKILTKAISCHKMIFVKTYGEEKLLDCLERNEKNGIVYHREGINGDYDEFENVEELMKFIMTGKQI